MDTPTVFKNKTYRFKPLSLDVDMHVARVLWTYADGFKLKVIWINRFSPEILHEDKVFLKRKDLHKWEII
jgi:hypothetical protein